MKKVYLAGPDVFFENAQQLGKQYVQLAAKKGLQGLFPLDAELKKTHSEESLDKTIYLANKNMLESADVVVANLMDFRGLEPDSGTVWEVAYAVALGKIVVVYTPTSSTILERVRAAQQVSKGSDGQYRDKDGMSIEDFNNPFNLMIQHSVSAVVFGTLENALGKAAELCNQ